MLVASGLKTSRLGGLTLRVAAAPAASDLLRWQIADALVVDMTNRERSRPRVPPVRMLQDELIDGCSL
jgi:hypothetical protein